MRSRMLLLVGMTCLLACFGGCPGPSPAPTPIIYASSDSGTAKDLAVNDIFHVALESNPSTGFSWVLTQMDTNILTNTAQQYAPAPADSGLGAEGVDIWQFQAVAPGTTTLILEYRQAGDDTSAPADTFQLTVNVAAAQ